MTVLETPARRRWTSDERRVLVAAALGTVFEWYDFVMFGSLAGLIGQHFFSKAEPSIAFVFALLTFSAGFIVRPLGAIAFGRLGDLVGRKYTFLITILVMGFATFAVGLLPSYDSIGIAAPALLVSLRMLQGLAIGGEYGGAVVYVAEHAGKQRRGAFTSWIQVTATAGFILSLLVVLITRLSLGEPAFAAWGWRLPFLFSILLLGISVWIRMSLAESPVFARMKSQGVLSKAPVAEAFGGWANLKLVLTSLFGLTAGFGTVWYTTQFYTLLFLVQTLKVDAVTANIVMVIALMLALPFFVAFGTLSDRIGRKRIVLSGILLAALAYYPAFRGLTHFGNPALERAIATAPVKLIADSATCSFQFNLTGTSKFTTPCDVAKAKLAALSVSYDIETAPAGKPVTIMVGGKAVALADLATEIQAAGYPAKAAPAEVNVAMLTLIVFTLVFCLTMAYGPVAAVLVELFPARIRYTSLSLPYHIGTGWFGGLTPTFAFAMVAATGNIYSGLWFPILICGAVAIIGALIVPETRDFEIDR